MLDINQMRVKPSIIIQCIQSALESIGKDSSESSAIKVAKAFSKMSKKKRAMAEIILTRKPKSDMECIQCALEYAKLDSSEEAAQTMMDYRADDTVIEDEHGYPVSFPGIDKQIQFLGKGYNAFEDCREAIRDYRRREYEMW